MYLRYIRNQKLNKVSPYKYVDGNADQNIFYVIYYDHFNGIEDMQDPIRYLVTGRVSSITLYKNLNGQDEAVDYGALHVCERYTNSKFIRRWFAYDTSKTQNNVKNSVCYCRPTKSTIKSETSSYNLPDCAHNNTIFDLDFSKTSLNSFDVYVYEWYNIIFKQGIEYTLNIKENKELKAYQACRFNGNIISINEGSMKCETSELKNSIGISGTFTSNDCRFLTEAFELKSGSLYCLQVSGVANGNLILTILNGSLKITTFDLTGKTLTIEKGELIVESLKVDVSTLC